MEISRQTTINKIKLLKYLILPVQLYAVLSTSNLLKTIKKIHKDGFLRDTRYFKHLLRRAEGRARIEQGDLDKTHVIQQVTICPDNDSAGAFYRVSCIAPLVQK